MYTHFTSAIDCFISNHIIRQGDNLRTFHDNEGLYWLLLSWSDDPIARLPAYEINRLAGEEVVDEEFQ